MSEISKKFTSNLSVTYLICLLCPFSHLEYKPKQADPATKVLRTVLCSGRGQKYPYCGDEQSSSSDHPHAH